MALIKCPECGREKVSDSALACPDCGFAIREYTNKKNKNEPENDTKKDVEKVKSLKQETISSRESYAKPIRCPKCGAIYPSAYDKCPTCGGQDVSTNNRNSLTTPHSEKPRFTKGYIIGIVVGLIVGLIGVPGLFENESSRLSSMSHGNGDPVVRGIILIIFGIIIIGITLGIFVRKVSRYNLKINNPELYNRIIAEETRKGQERYRAQQQAEQIRLSKLPECPICKSKTNVRRNKM